MSAALLAEGITQGFNLLSTGLYVGGGIAALAVGGIAVKFLSPMKMIKPTADKAWVVTGYNGPIPFLHSQKFVVKDKPQAVWKVGMSDPQEVDLKSYVVNVTHKGIHAKKDKNGNILERAIEDVEGQKDESLTLGDNIKAEVDVDFYVQVETEDTIVPALFAPDVKDKDGNVIEKGKELEKEHQITGTQNIIDALKTLGGKVDQKTIDDYIKSKAGSALRAAAAQMTFDEIQKDRDAFIHRVRANFSLHGLKVTDAALKEFKQAPIESFDPKDYLAAQGLKKVTEVTNAALQAVNISNQETQTAIALKNKEQEIQRYTIEQDKTQAELARIQRIAQMTAEQARQVKEIQAEQEKAGNIARIVAEQATQERDIAKDREIAIANAQKDEVAQVRREQADQAAAQARIAKEQAVEIANRAKEIALQNKAAEVAEAEQAANLKRADAVVAEQGVVTAKETAEADRDKKVAVIRAEQVAQEAAAGKKIDADVQVYVAEKGAEAKKKEGEGIQTLATAQAAAAKISADGSYATEYQPLKAKADGKLADAAAQKALNDAINALSDAARQFQVDMNRVDKTPEIVTAFAAGMASIDDFHVTSINGAPGFSNSGAGNGADVSGASANNVFEQFYGAARANMLSAPLLRRLITDMGGDPKIVDNLPGLNTPVPAQPSICTTLDPESTKVPAGVTAKASAPGPSL